MPQGTRACRARSVVRAGRHAVARVPAGHDRRRQGATATAAAARASRRAAPLGVGWSRARGRHRRGGAPRGARAWRLDGRGARRRDRSGLSARAREPLHCGRAQDACCRRGAGAAPAAFRFPARNRLLAALGESRSSCKRTRGAAATPCARRSRSAARCASWPLDHPAYAGTRRGRRTRGCACWRGRGGGAARRRALGAHRPKAINAGPANDRERLAALGPRPRTLDALAPRNSIAAAARA